ncbi:MAG TPA: alpha/beta family hydrolase [Actinomycetota bacterium]|nr:alpha/beta family hydrolase [Actinomycetota bacterium]
MTSESVSLDAGELRVQAEVDAPEGKPAACFLLTHGAGGDRNTAGLRALAEGLAAAGSLVVRPDLPYRAAGRSSPPLAERSVPGFLRIYESAREMFGGARWIAGGRSYGGRVASMAVAQGLDAAGLLLWSYPLHRPGDPSQPRVAHWRRIKVPTLFLEGTRDPFCDPATFARHLPELGVEPLVHFVEGGDHSLKVAKANAPDGKGRSEASVVATLVPVIRDWVQTL